MTRECAGCRLRPCDGVECIGLPTCARLHDADLADARSRPAHSRGARREHAGALRRTVRRAKLVAMPRAPQTIFLLSPASLGGERARILLRPQASFPLARALRTPPGASLGEVFSFLSGLYFRGKATYARAFARPPRGVPGALVITSAEGLVQLDEPVDATRLGALAGVPIDVRERRYLEPLLRTAMAIEAGIGPRCRVVLLGSIATDKYVAPLHAVFGDRLVFPPDFVGRGDMSRGGLLLRAAAAGAELAYGSIVGAVRHGARPPRLPPRRRAAVRPELALLIGLPGAGKSTFHAARLAATHAHASRDAMPRRNDQRALFAVVAQALAARRAVAVDNVNATKAERAALIALAVAAGARVVGYWLDTPASVCIERNRERTGKARVPPVAIFTAAKRLQPPTSDEGFTKLWRVGTAGTRDAPTFALRPVAGR